MPDDIALTIRRRFPRPDPALLQAFAEAPTGNICDAQGRRGALSHHIKPISRAVKFCGPALVVDAGPRDNLAAWAALDVAEAGDVVVIATTDYQEASVIGDNYVAMARNAGVCAVVTDGVVRDIAGIDEVGLPVRARGLSPNSPWKNGPGTVGLSASIGGIFVHSGDILVGDVDGVVVVPLASAAEVGAALAAVLDKERAAQAAIAGGARAPGWLADAYRDKGVRWLDGE